MVFTGCRLDGRRDGAIVEVDACHAEAEAGPVVLRDVTFVNNSLKGNASAVSAAAAACASFEMRDVRFENNECSGICFAHLPFNNSLRNVKMEGNARTSGGHLVHVLISLPPGSATVASGLMASRNGMTVMSVNGSVLNLTRSRFHGNANGSAIVLHEATGVSISNCSFSRNRADDSGGAAMDVVQSQNVRTSHCRFDRNVAIDGGSVAVSKSTLRLDETTFHNNSASARGGALYVEDSALDIHHGQFSGNWATDGGSIAANASVINASSTAFAQDIAAESGGSIIALQRCRLSFDNVSVISADAQSGGGLYLSHSHVEARGLRVRENRAREDGGGLRASSSSTILCSLCVFENNTAGHRGGAVSLNATGPQMPAYQFADCQFVENRAQVGGAISCSDETRRGFPSATCRCFSLPAPSLGSKLFDCGSRLHLCGSRRCSVLTELCFGRRSSVRQ